MVISKTQIIRWLEKAAVVLQENRAYLTELDSAIGDADHGSNMVRGFNAVLEKLPGVADQSIGNLFKATGMALMSNVGGASGPLYGAFFMRAASVATAQESLSAEDLFRLLDAGMHGIVQRGRAQPGDKTMIDAWMPALAALRAALDAGQDLPTALHACVHAAAVGMQATIPLQAKKGRASYLGERSIGHQDAGATSTYLLLNALLDSVSNA